jgi:RND superfamily putative drug exporter
VLFLLSLFVFRSLVAALLPLAVGMASILVTFALMRLVNEVEPMSVFAINLITGLGLGLSIDYSLFMVSRFREELERGAGTSEALRATLASAGRTVIFSALTVAAALAALIVFRQRFLFSMGIGGALVALVAAFVSLTLLPALLAALGPRVNALSPRRWREALHRDAAQVRAGFWYRLSQAVMRRPAAVAGATALVLILAGLPFLRIEFTGVDASVLPQERSARVVSDALTREFPGTERTSLYVAVRAGSADAPEVMAYAERLRDVPGAAGVAPEEAPRGGWWRLDVAGDAGLLDEASRQLVADVRAVDAPSEVLVGGFTANFVDQQASLAERLPLALLLLCSTTLVLLFS